MAFKVDSQRYFKHTVSLPGDKDGQPQTMDVTYRALDDEQVKEVNLLDTELARSFLRDAIEDISDLITEDGKKVPYTEELLDQLTTALDVRQALVRGYGIGLGKASTGN